MANACKKCGYFPVQCRCAELSLQAANKKLASQLSIERTLAAKNERRWMADIKAFEKVGDVDIAYNNGVVDGIKQATELLKEA